jgi:hypothetical protein
MYSIYHSTFIFFTFILWKYSLCSLLYQFKTFKEDNFHCSHDRHKNFDDNDYPLCSYHLSTCLLTTRLRDLAFSGR